MTKMRQRGRNDAAELLNDGLINGDAAELREKTRIFDAYEIVIF